VDVGDAMRRRGYPSADVAVNVEPASNNRVRLQVEVEPGARVEFEFEGVELRRSMQRSIAAAYRPADLGEVFALEELQREAVRELHALGYIEPTVKVDSTPRDPSVPEGARLIRVSIDGGRRLALSTLIVEGVGTEEQERIAEIFASTTRRLELVRELPAADALLLRAMSQLGYPQARISGRVLSEDGETLTLEIDPGPRRMLASIAIEGLDEEDRDRLMPVLQVQLGAPARADLIAADARAIERDLRGRGYPDARVRARTRPVDDEHPFDVELVFEAETGSPYRVGEVRFEGLGASREKWVARTAGLTPGEPFEQRDVADARARLFRTGVFRTVRASSVSDGDAKDVTFDLEESRRWRLAYGARWEDTRGISGVVDLLNSNSLGIGHLSGVRVIYGGYDQSLRLYHIIPRIVGGRSSLELFLEGRNERLADDLDLRANEAWAQLTFPLTRRTQNRVYVRFQDPELVGDGEPEEPIDERVISPLLGWQLAYDRERRRAGEQRRQGIFIGVDLLGSHTALGSDVTSVGVVSQLKYFMPLGKSQKGRFTWAQFWRGGITEAQDGPVPLVDRFRAGGEFSVRGYPTNSLGPLSPDGVPLGGEVLFIVNQELHAQLVRTERLGIISALIFFDAGNVFLDRQTLDTGLFKSVGVGARYQSPFGPLRLDFAVPLDRRPDDPASKLYLGFGSVF
jgi:outer membrane protein assembly factor BamA